jgi:hypothetical protein
MGDPPVQATEGATHLPVMVSNKRTYEVTRAVAQLPALPLNLGLSSSLWTT